jgi:hypothetical protein
MPERAKVVRIEDYRKQDTEPFGSKEQTKGKMLNPERVREIIEAIWNDKGYPGLRSDQPLTDDPEDPDQPPPAA